MYNSKVEQPANSVAVFLPLCYVQLQNRTACQLWVLSDSAFLPTNPPTHCNLSPNGNPDNNAEDAPLMEYTYLVFTHRPAESYCRWLRSLLLYLCYVFQVLIYSLVGWFQIIATEIFSLLNLEVPKWTEQKNFNTTLGKWSNAVYNIEKTNKQTKITFTFKDKVIIFTTTVL